jgi:hypothetical protein
MISFAVAAEGIGSSADQISDNSRNISLVAIAKDEHPAWLEYAVYLLEGDIWIAEMMKDPDHDSSIESTVGKW